LIADLQPYPAYRDSGVEWLGEVPEGWEVLPARSLFREIVDRDHPDEKMLSVTIKDGVIPQSNLLEGSSSKDASNLDRSSYKLVQPGDIAYNKMRAWQGAAGCSSVRGIVSPAYIVLRARGPMRPRFAHRLLRIPAFAKEAERWSYGITSDQWSLRAGDFRQIYFPMPPVATQATIVRFLDVADSRIDRFIAAKERLIELLDEEKQAIVRHAVTCGLDRSVRFEPSGVGWIGEMPEHWEVKELRRLGRILGGLTPAMDRSEYWEGSIPWVSPKDMKRAEIDSSTDSVTPLALAETNLRPVPPGSVLMVVRGMILARRVPVAWTSAEVTINQDMKAIVPGGEISGGFLARALEGAQVPLMQMIDAAGHGTRRLPTERWRRLPLPVPPVAEQRAIVADIDRRTALADGVRSRALRQIALLREYRTRLASNVATGKLDVRAAAATLPDDPGAEGAALEGLEEAVAG
jgi:type I restriction enzyme S subunit